MTTKAERILTLARADLTTRQIAEAVYGEATKGKMAYVRVVTRQRKGGGSSKHDVAWRKANPDKVRATKLKSFKRRYADPVWRAQYQTKANAQRRARYATNPNFRASELARAATNYYARATNQP